jgi:hypothetical protein
MPSTAMQKLEEVQETESIAVRSSMTRGEDHTPDSYVTKLPYWSTSKQNELDAQDIEFGSPVGGSTAVLVKVKGPRTVTGEEGEDCGPLPSSFLARTVQIYVMPPKRFETFTDRPEV